MRDRGPRFKAICHVLECAKCDPRAACQCSAPTQIPSKLVVLLLVVAGLDRNTMYHEAVTQSCIRRGRAIHHSMNSNNRQIRPLQRRASWYYVMMVAQF